MVLHKVFFGMWVDTSQSFDSFDHSRSVRRVIFISHQQGVLSAPVSVVVFVSFGKSPRQTEGVVEIGVASETRKSKRVSLLHECICGDKNVTRIAQVINGETLEILAQNRCKPVRPLFRIK